MVENTYINNKSSAMRLTNQSVLDLYLETICSGNVESQDLEYLLSSRNTDTSGDKKLIQHLRGKINSGEIRVYKSKSNIVESSQSQLKTKHISYVNKIYPKSNLIRES